MKNKQMTKTMMMIALLISLAVILKFFQLQITPANRITFYNIPIMMVGMLFGPLAGLVAGGLTDFISIIYQPGWLPWYVFPAMMWGFIPGVLGKVFKSRGLGNLFLIEIITHLIVSTINTLILGLMLGFDVALGMIETAVEIGFNFFGLKVILLKSGTQVYLRIIVVLIVMIIKIPLDVLLMSQIFRRTKIEERLLYD